MYICNYPLDHFKENTTVYVALKSRFKLLEQLETLCNIGVRYGLFEDFKFSFVCLVRGHLKIVVLTLSHMNFGTRVRFICSHE